MWFSPHHHPFTVCASFFVFVSAGFWVLFEPFKRSLLLLKRIFSNILNELIDHHKCCFCFWFLFTKRHDFLCRNKAFEVKSFHLLNTTELKMQLTPSVISFGSHLIVYSQVSSLVTTFRNEIALFLQKHLFRCLSGSDWIFFLFLSHFISHLKTQTILSLIFGLNHTTNLTYLFLLFCVSRMLRAIFCYLNSYT